MSLPVISRVPPGVRYMVLSALAFSVMGAFVKLLGARGYPVMEIVAARCLVSLVLSYYLLRRKRIPVWGERKGLLLARGFVGFVSLSFVYYALTLLPYAEATVLQYLHPMFTAVLALLLLKERPTAATLACIALSFAGLLLIARPGFVFGQLQTTLPTVGIVAGIAGAFGSACAYVLVRKLSQSEHPLVIVFYFPLVALPATVPFLINDFVMPAGWDWFYLLAVGLATQVGQVALTHGMQLETAARATSFSYLQVVFATLIGIAVFSELPSLWTVTGAALIVAGAYANLVWKSQRTG